MIRVGFCLQVEVAKTPTYPAVYRFTLFCRTTWSQFTSVRDGLTDKQTDRQTDRCHARSISATYYIRAKNTPRTTSYNYFITNFFRGEDTVQYAIEIQSC